MEAMAFEISRFLSVKYTIMFKLFIIVFCLSYISAAPVSPSISSYKEFMKYLSQNKCRMPKGINVPYPTLNAPLELCQKDDSIQRKETLYLCKEAFQTVKNITCSSVNVVPPIRVPLSPDVCQDFTNLHELIPKSSTSIGTRLADTLICNIICADELNEVCRFLLWTYQVQYKVATFQAEEANADVQENGEDLQTSDKNKTATLDSGKPSKFAPQNHSDVNALKVNSSVEDIKNSPKSNDVAENVDKIPDALQQAEDDHKKGDQGNPPINEKALSVDEMDQMKLKELSQNDSSNQVRSTQAAASISGLGENDLHGDILSQTPNTGTNIEDQVPVMDKISESLNNKKNKPDANDQNGGNFAKFVITGQSKQYEHNKNIKVKTSNELKPLPLDPKTSESDPDVGDSTKNAVLGNSTKDSGNDGKKIIIAGNTSGTAADKETKLPGGAMSEKVHEENVKPNTGINSGTEVKVAEPTAHVQPTEDISSSPSKNSPELSLIPTTVDVPLEQMEGENDNHPADKESDQYNGALEQPVKHKELDSKAPSPVIIKNEVTVDRSSLDKAFDNFPSRNSMSHGMPDDIPMISSLPDQEDSHFFFYFLSIVLILMAGYLIVHNKQKIIALIVEGRHERRRRSHGVGYKKLETK
ncbi:trans-Golgi network integral membrane protein 2-like isoform X2 [Stegodyphus dumicola]|uniref:trans-Golgi network integral membrane protein 2-like isoform X2 n=1 Tax=Stegodyphus dumicola TaxID=202533 RepID=UPI0015A90BAA|nr:trans-Golgi network integral membrane protein 2-like isoform X2 [Stegodyphus dumicola]